MKLATTTGDFKEYCKNHKEMVKCVADSGFRYIDLSLYDIDIPGSPFMAEDWKEYTLSLREYAENLGVTFVQAHSPGMRGNVLEKNEHYDYFLSATLRSVEVCGLLGIKNTVFHTGWKEGVSKEEYFRENHEFIKHIIPLLEKYNVTLCAENSTRVNMGTKYFFFDGKDLNEFVEYVNHPLVKACWDVGHANLEGHNYSDIVALGKNLATLHIHDNYTFDTHAMLFTGSLNMDEVMQALAATEFNGFFTMEADNIFSKGIMRKNSQFGGKLRNVPFELKLEGEKLLYKIGKWVLESYECFEE